MQNWWQNLGKMRVVQSIHLLHSTGIFFRAFQGRHLTLVGSILDLLVSFVDAKTKLDHPVDSLRVHGRLLKSKAGGEKGSLEEQHNQVLHRLVALVRFNPLSQILHNAVIRIDLKVLLSGHVPHGGGVSQSLGLHNPLHVCSPTVLRSDDAARRGDKSVRDNHLLNLLVQNVLHHLAEPRELLLVRLSFLLFLFIFRQFKTLLGDRDKVLPLILLQLLDNILVDGLSHVDNLKTTLLETFDERGRRHDIFGLSSDVVNVLLVLLHPGHVVPKTCEFVPRGRGVVPQESSQLLTIRRVLMNAKLQVLAELFIELLEVVLVLSHLLDQLHHLLHQVLPDHLEDLVLLEHFSRNIKGQILAVNDALDEVEVLGDEVFTVVHDEHPPDVQLDVVLGFPLALEEVEGRPLRYKKEGFELQLTFHAEMFNSKMLLPVVGQGLVELGVFFAGYVVSVPCPDRLGLVQLLLLRVLLLDGLLLRLLLSFSIPIFSNIFNLRLIFLSFLLLLLTLFGFFFFFVVVRHFSILLLLHGELDRITQ